MEIVDVTIDKITQTPSGKFMQISGLDEEGFIHSATGVSYFVQQAIKSLNIQPGEIIGFGTFDDGLHFLSLKKAWIVGPCFKCGELIDLGDPYDEAYGGGKEQHLDCTKRTQVIYPLGQEHAPV